MTAGIVDARAGKICSNCNAPKPSTMVIKHCPSPSCTWWRCNRCKANNDQQGRNSETALDGTSKTGRTYG